MVAHPHSHVCLAIEATRAQHFLRGVAFDEVNVQSPISDIVAMSLIEWLIHFILWTRLVFCSPATPDDRRTLLNNAESRDATNATLSVSTLSAVPIPEDFKVELLATQAIRYPSGACYLNTVHALEEIALDEFEGLMPRFRFTSPKYPGVIVTAIPPDNSDLMERRVVVWGMFLAVRHMALQKAFQPTLFQLKWSDQDVGRIEYSRPTRLISRPRGQQQQQQRRRRRRQQMNETDNISMLERPGAVDIHDKNGDDGTVGSSLQVVPAAANDNDNDDHLLIHFRYFGRSPPMAKADVFLTVLAALVQAAGPPAAADAHTAFTAA
ncbi:MAG: hypothetical protein Q9207_006478, partial [Kuettlingeria erythrocarpa]